MAAKRESLWTEYFCAKASRWMEEELRIRGAMVMANKKQLESGRDGSPSDIMGLLKACTTQKDLGKGSRIHAYVQENRFLEENAYIGATLVNMYAKCGALAKAHRVLEDLPVRNLVTWSALIAGYIQQGKGEKALDCYDSMQHEGHSPDAVTLTCALKACGCIGAAAKGKEIHDKIVSLNILEKDIMLGNALVDMYAKCSELAKAQQVLQELPVRNVVTWSALIAGYAQQGQGGEALKCYDNMLHEGHSPNEITFVSALKACGSIGAAAKGEEIHDKIVCLGMMGKNIMLGSALVDMYAKCGALAKAHCVLKELPVRNVVTWSALVAGYVQQCQGEEALKCYDIMLHEGHCPDAVTFICALKACGSIGAAAKGEEIHKKIVSLDMLEKDVVLNNALVDMYVKCGALSLAQGMLKELTVQTSVMCSSLMAGYIQQGQGVEALKCYSNLLHDGQTPDAVTLSCALKACEIIGATASDKIVNLGMLGKDAILVNGALVKVQEALEEPPVGNVVLWSALIGGHAQQGQTLEAVHCFEMMQLRGVKPDSATLICMLNACSHSGLVDQAETYFLDMSSKYGIRPDLEHYSCMVDLFARVGKFKKALSVIGKMSSDYLPAWIALLGACRKWREVKIGKLAFESALYLDKSSAANYVLMASIYTEAGMQEDAVKIELLRVTNNA